MNYLAITEADIANGQGVRVTLWVTGCEHHCPGCHNPQTWDETNGYAFTPYTQQKLIDWVSKDHIQGLTVSGGDPFHPDNVETVTIILFNIVAITHKDIWVYTGYTWEELIADEHMRKTTLPLIDVLVDGEYKEDLRDISLKWCGSSNQRVIDVQKSLKEGKVVLWED